MVDLKLADFALLRQQLESSYAPAMMQLPVGSLDAAQSAALDEQQWTGRRIFGKSTFEKYHFSSRARTDNGLIACVSYCTFDALFVVRPSANRIAQQEKRHLNGDR